jgi:outer membrane receptor for ferrienterochelin and colicin
MVPALRLALVLIPLAAVLATAQGVTTGSLAGRIFRLEQGAMVPLGGATVKAVHGPTGAVYGAYARSNGAYTIKGMRTGGPYTVTVTFVGYRQSVRTNISIRLGETTTADFVLEESASSTKEVVVKATDDPLFDRSKTGAGSVITGQMISSAPTINRSISDMARLNHYANQVQTSGSDGLQGVSIAGVNSRFNNFQIDGAVANDLFSLSTAGTAGGQANANTISLDAIEELKVNVSPYDVRQSGFTGGLINAVTRGGTNTWTGSVFAYGRNEDFVGPSPDANRRPFDAFSDMQLGGRIGGPIVRDKLLFHVTAETRRRRTPLEVGLNDPNALNNFPVSAGVLDDIIQAARDRWNFDAGSRNPFVVRNNTVNLIGRVDWNIDEQHKIQLRHNYTYALQDRNVQRTSTNFSLSSQANEFTSINNQTVLQWNGIFGEDLANELRISYTRTTDERVLRIQVASGVNVVLGAERNSQANALDQTQLAITDDLTWFVGDHNITIGTHNEVSWFDNLFIQDFYGTYQFPSIDAFREGTPNQYQVSWANEAVVGGQTRPRTTWSMMQLGLYVMDEWQITSDLRLVGGMRVDAPIYTTTPYENPVFAQRFPGRATSEVPQLALLYSPRAGFNWDVFGDRTLQMRGGTGLFTGRVAAVWLSNQYGNTGMDIFRAVVGSNNSQNVIIDPVTRLPVTFDLRSPRPPRPGDEGYPGAISTSAINITDKDFRLPQVWRSTLGFDVKVDDGLTWTMEGMYGAFLNTVDYANINLKPSGMGVSPIDGRPMYAGESGDSVVAREFTQVLLLRSRNEGYQYSVSTGMNLAENNRWVPGLSAMLAYTFGHTYDLNSGTQATALSQWNSTDVIDPNNATVGRSNFDVPHRVVLNASYRFEWTRDVATTITVFYAGSSGRPYSLSYINDYNGDNALGGNDLIYVPRPEDKDTKVVIVPPSGTDLRTPDQVWTQIMDLIEQNPVLKEYQGRILPRNALREPWVNQLDLRILQRLPGFGNQTIDISFDVQNVLNLLSADWGLQRFVNFQSFNLFGLGLINGKPFDEQGRLRMTYTEPVTNGRPGIYTTDNFFSRWRMQIGVRYNF